MGVGGRLVLRVLSASSAPNRAPAVFGMDGLAREPHPAAMKRLLHRRPPGEDEGEGEGGSEGEGEG